MHQCFNCDSHIKQFFTNLIKIKPYNNKIIIGKSDDLRCNAKNLLKGQNWINLESNVTDGANQ